MSRSLAARRPYLAVLQLEGRDLPSALGDAALQLITDRVSENGDSFYVYRDADSGFNHGFPSGFFAGDGSQDRPDLRNQIQIDLAAVNDSASPTGTTNDPTRFDRDRGTVVRLALPALTGGEFVGVYFEEPEFFLGAPSGTGYVLTGAQRVYVDARSPTPGGMDVQFGVGGRNTDRFSPVHVTDTFTTFAIELADLRNPDTNAVAPPALADTHLLFSVLTAAGYEPEGGTILLDNIRFDPPPANPFGRPAGEDPRPSLPLGNETFGVVPAVVRAANDDGATFVGAWATETGRPGSYKGDRHTTTGGAGAGTAAWTFTGLPPRVYELQATWEAGAANTTAAPYALFDGATGRGTVNVDQTQAPAGSTFDGSGWKSLGTVQVVSGTLRVELSNAGVGAGAVVVADGVRIVPVIPPDQAVRNLATVYESALVVFALLQRGRAADLLAARHVADSFLYALGHDSTGGGAALPAAPDGSRGLRDSYSSGDLPLRNDQSPPKDSRAGETRLAGFTTDTRLTGPSGFALVLDGAFGGNDAFAVMALTTAYRRLGDVKYLDGAREIGRWIHGSLLDPNGPAFNPNPATQSYGGYFLGYPDQGVPKDRVASLVRGKSIENNGDIFAAFTMLAEAEAALGDAAAAAVWTERANIAGDFVMAMYEPGDATNSRDGHFNAGTLFDPAGAFAPGPGLDPKPGSKRGDDVINQAAFLDSNTFTTLPLAGAARYRTAIDWREPVRFVADTFARTITATTGGVSRTYTGYSIFAMPTTSQFRPGGPIGGLPTGIAWEFTGQVPVVMGYVDRLYGTTEFTAAAQDIVGQLRAAQVSAPFGDGEGLVAATVDGENDVGGNPPLDQGLGTPFQFIPERVGLAATAWAVFADRGVNFFVSEGVNPAAPISRTLAVGGAPDGSVVILTPTPAGAYTFAATAPVNPFVGVRVQVRPASGDVDRDGYSDTVMVTGPGTPIRVAVVSGRDNTTILLAPFDPFGGDFRGGGFVAAADMDADGAAEFVVTPDQGGGPRVSIFSLVNGKAVERASFLGIEDANFRGGARAALADVNADGRPDVVVAAGFGGGPRAAVFGGPSVLARAPARLVGDFFAFPGSDAVNLRNGAFVAAGDVTGDGFADLVFGGGPDGAPRVFILSGAVVSAGNVSGAQAVPVANFFVAGDDRGRGGARVAVADADGDARADVAVGSGAGRPARVRLYLGKDFAGGGEPAATDLDVLGGAVLADGVYVG